MASILCAHIFGFKVLSPQNNLGWPPKRHILNGRDSIISKVASLETTGMLSQRENMVENSQSDIFLKTNTGNCVFIFSWRLRESKKHMWVGGGFILYTAAVTHLGGNTRCKLGLDSGALWNTGVYALLQVWVGRTRLNMEVYISEMHGKCTAENGEIFSLLTKEASQIEPFLCIPRATGLAWTLIILPLDCDSSFSTLSCFQPLCQPSPSLT